MSVFEQTWPLMDPSDELRPGAPRTAASALRAAAYQMLARARRLSTGDAANRQLAVIFAISACELHTEQGLTHLMRGRRSGLHDIVVLLGTTFNLGNIRAQKIYSDLTDDYPWGDATRQRAPAAWWADWHAGCVLRHEVAHAGRAVSPDEAARSIRCGVSYVAHVTDAVGRALSVPRQVAP